MLKDGSGIVSFFALPFLRANGVIREAVQRGQLIDTDRFVEKVESISGQED